MTDITQRIQQASMSLRQVWARHGDSEEFWAAANEVQEALGDGVPPEDEFVVVEAMQAILHSIGAISDEDMRGFV